jgi:Reverse transcriptase (RNA-dependent DNA polymerase)
MKDRAMQALYLLALLPVAETTADPNSYGFRPKRSTADTIEQCFRALSQKHSARWVLEGDISGCFDNISHAWMLGQMADGVLSAEDFTRLHKSTVKAIADLRERLAFAESEVLDLDSAIEYLTHILWNTSIAWQTSDLQGKKRVQRRMFPEGLVYGETGFGTPVTHSIYTLLASDSMDESRLVAPQGFRRIANKRVLRVSHSDTRNDTLR